MRRFVASLTATLVLSLCSVAPAQLPVPVTEPPAASIFGEGARTLPALPPEVTDAPPAAVPADTKAGARAEAGTGTEAAPVIESDPFLDQYAEPVPAKAPAAAQAPATAPADSLRRIPDSVDLPEMTEPTVGFQAMQEERAPRQPAVSLPPVQYEPQVRRGVSRSQELIFQRAAVRARQRLARQETRKWQGVSLSRPRVVHGSHSENLNRGMWPTTGGAFASPAWLRAIR